MAVCIMNIETRVSRQGRDEEGGNLLITLSMGPGKASMANERAKVRRFVGHPRITDWNEGEGEGEPDTDTVMRVSWSLVSNTYKQLHNCTECRGSSMK